MPTPTWHDINEPGTLSVSRKEKLLPAQTTAEAEQPVVLKKKEDPEVRLSDPAFLPGPDGFDFNKECTLQCRIAYLKKTIRTRIFFDLLVEYNGSTEDLRYQVEGFPDDDGIVQARAKLYFGNEFHKDYQTDPRLKCHYKFKAHHSRGKAELESRLLEIPDRLSGKPFRVQLAIDPDDPDRQQDKITLYSTDSEKTYRQVKTVADDKEAGDDYLDLEFSNFVQGLEYTLEIEQADGESYTLFENLLIDGKEGK
jgi:hypothetical protein